MTVRISSNLFAKLVDTPFMKMNLRFVSPLLVVIAASSIPLLGCKRLTSEALENAADRATEAAFKVASDGGMDLRIGHLPDDFPKSAPIDPRADVLTADSVHTGDGDRGWMAAFQTDESPEQVLAFYDSRMQRMSAGDAGQELADLEARMSTPNIEIEGKGAQTTTTTPHQKQVMTPFDFGAQGMLILRTFKTDTGDLEVEKKNTIFTLIVVNTGRPKT